MRRIEALQEHPILSRLNLTSVVSPAPPNSKMRRAFLAALNGMEFKNAPGVGAAAGWEHDPPVVQCQSGPKRTQRPDGHHDMTVIMRCCSVRGSPPGADVDLAAPVLLLWGVFGSPVKRV
jgi:hypothetical protein